MDGIGRCGAGQVKVAQAPVSWSYRIFSERSKMDLSFGSGSAGSLLEDSWQPHSRRSHGQACALMVLCVHPVVSARQLFNM